MKTSDFVILAAIGFYLIGMLFIGFYYSHKNNSSDDFYLGGRKLGPFVVAMSAEASDMSSWLLMGLPGVAYLTGVADAFWTAVGLAVGTYLNWLIMARRIRRYSQNIGAITIPDFLSKRFHDKSNVLNCIAAVMIVVFFVPYTASGFAACGKLFHSLFGIDYMTAMLISAIVIFSYTVMGGFMAASTTDLIQSVVMTIALFVVLIYGTHMAGGVDAVMQNAQALEGYLSFSATHNPATGAAESYSPLTVASNAAWGLGYFGMPHILLRFMAIEDEKKLVLSRRIASVWAAVSMCVAIVIGIVGYGMSKAGAIEMFTTSGQSETIIVKVAGLLSLHGVIPAAVAGIILAGILAATMSTADSQLLAASSSVSQNLVVDFFKVKLTNRQGLRVARLTVLAISIIACFLARNPDSSVFQIVSFAWAGFGGAFGAVMILSLFWERTNRDGALAGMLSGGVMVFIWKFLVRPMGGVWGIYELLPAFVVSMIVTILVSVITPAPDAEVIAEFRKTLRSSASEEK
ncbi:sodium/proline symporter [[Clostridium] aminophilum]|uniref:Sodium/proline symporter n=1 Tax=[Clostridium] aminophilum TaxID=1526 RepID=A0A1I0I4U1_9FIRM|nr:sodium/proline symporter [[Clostridium] aminophilum]SET91650.1 sodium/proline symporter [[Clostridium] aminophilum]